MPFKLDCIKWIGFPVILSLIVSCSLGPGYSYKKGHSSKKYSSKVESHSPNHIWRPSKRNTVPFVMNARVKKWVKAFNGPLRPSFSRWVNRLGQYGPTIEKLLKEEGAPPDIIYLAMIESGFNMNAISHASAAGPWQFIRSTGNMYGLKNGFFVDERQDYFQATRAAARHLKDLYKVYGHWYLAFSAYNAGPGKVNRAIKRGRTKDYWKLSSRRSRHLRQETKDYVPKILAAMHIVKNYKKYGYNMRSFGDPIQYERVVVPDATDFNVIAKSANTSVQTIRTLNPSLIVGITPPGKRFAIYIPKGAKKEFQKNYTKVPASKRVSNLQYRTGNKETIATIAKKYRVSASRLSRVNGYKSKQKLRKGTLIKIPASKSTLLAMAKTGTTSYYSRKKSTQKVIYYSVRPGDTLSRIARKNRTSTSKLVKWNRLKKSSKLRIGQKLKIYRKSKGRSSSGNFIAHKGTRGRKRVSGIAHIIIQDQTNPATFTPSSSNQYNLPQMVAQADEFTSTIKNEPTLIKTLEGEILADDKLNKNKAKTKTTKVAKKYHIIKSGETLSTIAAKYGLRVSELKTLNKLKSDNIRIKQKLLVHKANTKKKIASKPKKSLYVVKPNDSLYSIARKYRVTVSQLKSWNGLKSDNIRTGKKLIILRGSHNTKTVATKIRLTNSKKVIFHHVKSGETLWSLSKKYNVKISDIMKWNKLKNDQVKPKQKIKIIAAANTSRNSVKS